MGYDAQQAGAHRDGMRDMRDLPVREALHEERSNVADDGPWHWGGVEGFVMAGPWLGSAARRFPGFGEIGDAGARTYSSKEGGLMD